MEQRGGIRSLEDKKRKHLYYLAVIWMAVSVGKSDRWSFNVKLTVGWNFEDIYKSNLTFSLLDRIWSLQTHKKRHSRISPVPSSPFLCIYNLTSHSFFIPFNSLSLSLLVIRDGFGGSHLFAIDFLLLVARFRVLLSRPSERETRHKD